MSISLLVGLLRLDVERELVAVEPLDEIADRRVGELAIEGEFAALVSVLNLQIRGMRRDQTRKKVGVLSAEMPKNSSIAVLS